MFMVFVLIEGLDLPCGETGRRLSFLDPCRRGLSRGRLGLPALVLVFVFVGGYGVLPRV
jgi:hypothetical protein